MFPIFRGGGRKKKTGLPARRQHERDGRWCKVDRQWLTTGLSLAHANEVLHGPTAEFYPDGQIRRLSVYYDGKPSTVHNYLELERGIPRGRVIGEGVLCTFDYGLEEIHLVFEGEVEFSSEPAQWEDWVRRWIMQICAGQRVNILPDND